MSASEGEMPDKRLLRIVPCTFAVSLAIGIVNLGMIFLIKADYGAGPAIVGSFTALWAAAYFVGCLAFRPLSGRLNASISTILMCFVSAALLTAQFALPSLVVAFVASSLYGLSTALVWPRIMGWLASGLEGRALSRASSYYSISWSIGMTLSPYFAGALSERGRSLGFGGTLPIYIGAAILAATGIFMIVSRRVAPAPKPAVIGASRDRGEDRSTPLRYPAWIALFAIYVLYSVLNNIFPLFAKDELSMSESAIGLLLLLRAAAMAGGFWVFGRLRFWQFKPVFLPIALALTFSLNLAFSIVHSIFGIALLLVLLGLFQAFSYALSLFYCASGAADLDRRMSVHEAVLTVGQIAGAVGGGAAYQGISWPAVFIFSALLALICLPAQIALSRKR